MNLNLRDCSAGSPEVDAGLVWGRTGMGLPSRVTLCQNLIPLRLACGLAAFG